MTFVCAAGVSECALAGPALIKGECHHYVQIFKGNAHELATMEDEAFTESVSGIAEPSVRYVVTNSQHVEWTGWRGVRSRGSLCRVLSMPGFSCHMWYAGAVQMPQPFYIRWDPSHHGQRCQE